MLERGVPGVTVVLGCYKMEELIKKKNTEINTSFFVGIKSTLFEGSYSFTIITLFLDLYSHDEQRTTANLVLR